MTKKINLALQGGGAHGAFTWGVLDAILEDGRLHIDGLSATSAGAMNAVVYAYGKMRGGADGARQALHDYWYDLASTGKIYSPVRMNSSEEQALGWGEAEESFSYYMFDSFTRMFSPYQFNPLNINPLKEVLLRHVDFDQLKFCNSVKLFISATNVRTNRIKIFNNNEMSVDAVMASACLPTLFQAVEVNGEFYWDGGYMGNPAIFPLFYKTDTDDMMVIHINPIERNEVPKEPKDILNRVNEISFNSSLLREFRAIAFVQKMLEEGWIKDEFRDCITHKRFFMHSIRADEVMKHYSLASKYAPNWEFLQTLHEQGRQTAKSWLDAHYNDIGKRSTVDLHDEYLDQSG